MYLRLIIIFCAGFLIFDSVGLMLQAKFHIGILFSFLLAILSFLIALFWRKIHLLIKKSIYLKYLWYFLWISSALWLISVALFFNLLQQTLQPTIIKDAPHAIIVLGSGIEKDQPSATLAQRLDQAGQLYQKYPNTLIIVSGGVGFNRTLSEAKVMSTYLQKNYQIADTSILQESQSTSTYLNLLNSKPILEQNHITLDQPIVIVTSDFHTLRAKAIAKKLGYQQVISFAAPTPKNIRYYSWLREYFAFLSGYLLNEY